MINKEKLCLILQVSKLKEKLMKAEKEIKILMEQQNHDTNNHSTSSPSSSSFSGDNGVANPSINNGFENFFYVPYEDNYIHGIEWFHEIDNWV